jgi:lipopolysaccharide biosynthesis glycosyltransferase
MKTLVLTIAIGDYHQKMGEITHPLMRGYAARIGADFRVITEKKISQTTAHWEKFQIYDLLDVYDRILFLDTDIIVRGDCPNLFELVPGDALGAFDESLYYTDARDRMELTAREYGLEVMPVWDGRYFNTGAMVISRAHQKVFEKPTKEFDNFYEQTYLNLVFVREGLRMFPLDFRFNRMHPMSAHTGEPRLSSYIVHYAGYTAEEPEMVYDYIRADIERWRKRGVL